jgi:hypothetical protein
MLLRSLLDAALALRDRRQPPPGLDPASYRVRPAAVLLPKDAPAPLTAAPTP